MPNGRLVFARACACACAAAFALGCGGKTGAGAEHGADASVSDAPSTRPEGGPEDAAEDAPVGVPDGGPEGDGSCNGRVPTLHAPGEITCAPTGEGDECLTTADCADAGFEAACVCGNYVLIPGPNTCIASTCRVDADCGDGGYCSPSTSTGCSYPGCGGYHCHTCDDQCVNDSDCASDSCGVDSTGTWVCLSPPKTGCVRPASAPASVSARDARPR